jgi:hypothetical protein
VKSYLKCGKAFRIETVVNDTGDLGLLRGLEHLEELSVKARDVNPSHGRCFCVSVRALSLRAQPLRGSRDHPWWMVGRPQPRGSATLGSWPCPGALCALVHTITGFTNRSLRAQVAILLGAPYSMSQMSDDLRRLRLKGLITRLPHTNTYVLTDEGQRVAIFYTKLHNRLLRPLLAAHDPPAATPATSPPSDRPPRRGLHPRGPHDRLKTWLKCQTPSSAGADHVRNRLWDQPPGRRTKRFLSPLQKYEIWLQLVRRQATIAEAAAAHQVDRSTIMRVRTAKIAAAYRARASTHDRSCFRRLRLEGPRALTTSSDRRWPWSLAWRNWYAGPAMRTVAARAGRRH